ncbi:MULTISPECIES: hypothetical protein [unclassified Nocardiopsis]|uniref:hypothetical protein n=1 Tax=Nocardiopsis TaxID=2013 RepID=UPI00387AC63B
MDNTDPRDRYVSEEFTSSRGHVWRAVVDTEADNGGLTEEESTAMVIAAIDRAEQQFEKMRRDQ